MVPVEIEVKSLRREIYDSEQNFILYWRKLNFLEEKWSNLQLWVEAYQRLIA